MTVAYSHSQRPRKRLSLFNAPFCTLMASLAANCFIWQQIDREEDRLPITSCVVAERIKWEVRAEQLLSDNVMVSTWLSDWNDSMENSDYLLSSNVILMSITSTQKEKIWSDLLYVLAIAPSWLQAYQVEGKTGWWTDWGIGRVSPSPVSPGSLPPSHQEIHRLCLWRWLHQGPWKENRKKIL